MFEKIFNEYASNYDFTNKDIVLKYNHSYRVRTLSLKYAKLLGFNKRDEYIAEFIGLYHDIGRFHQVEKYGTFNDNKSEDHASLAIEVLFDEGLINKFDFNEEEKEIIKYAINFHNKYALDDEKDERKIMHAKLIRDTDKIDIIFITAYLGGLKNEVVDEPLDEKLIEAFKEHKSVSYMEVPNFAICRSLAFSFDINYDVCIKEFKNNIKQYYKVLNNDKVLKEVYEEVIKYLDGREIEC